MPVSTTGPRPAVLLGLLLAAAPLRINAAPAGDEPAEELTLNLAHRNLLGSTFVPRSATYWMDGRPLFQLKDVSGGTLFRGPLEPGIHSISVRIIYEGQSSVFSYLDKYRFLMRGEIVVESRRGYGVKIISTAEEQSDVTVSWDRRPIFKLEGLPAKAVLSVNIRGIERASELDGGEEPDVSSLSPESAKALEDQVVAEVEEEAKKLVRRKAAAATPSDASEDDCSVAAIQFAFHQSVLDEEAKHRLTLLAQCLKSTPTHRVRLEGHCDRQGSDEFNNHLGQRRAQAALNFLLSHGVARSRLVVTSYGRSRPLCIEDSEACYARNRRVDIIHSDSKLGERRNHSSGRVLTR